MPASNATDPSPEAPAARPPLALYVHIPWCVRKCPYCDFNSHPARAIPEADYIDALLDDLDAQRPDAAGRPLVSLFIGGGTPSLFSPAAIGALLDGIAARLPLADDIEITLEANPGTAEAGRFAGYRAAGVNRLSLGIQSFDDRHLQALGRIHDAAQARAAVAAARRAGFERLNLDLMYGLPKQDPAGALADLEQALALAPEHLSWYQLTLEPGTPFYRQPPPLPDDERLWAIQETGLERLARAGYRRYEVSAFALEGHRCRHNLNYWRFGDYLGIGAGAHGKITRAGRVWRRARERLPGRYLRDPRGSGAHWPVDTAELPLEALMNMLRLTEGVTEALFEARTGLPVTSLEPALSELRRQGLMAPDRLQATPRGYDFLDRLLVEFHP